MMNINRSLLLLLLSSVLLYSGRARIIIEDDRDLTGCSVSLQEFIFNLKDLSRPNRLVNQLIDDEGLGLLETTKSFITMARETCLSALIFVNMHIALAPTISPTMPILLMKTILAII